MAHSAYENLWEKLDEFFMTAPKAAAGNPQPPFLKFLELVYTENEAELLQHLPQPRQFISTQEVLDAAGRPLGYVESTLTAVHIRNGLIGMAGFYADVKPHDLEAESARWHAPRKP